jgi:DNA (cytosine-5)-methyltransferase 1
LTVVDLFSGAGGMSSGFARHGGFRIVGAVDRQVGKPGRGKSAGTTTYCNSTFERNIGIAPIDADLSTLDPEELRTSLRLQRGELDVLISCAPCTGFSQKNARNHVDDDPRNKLVERTADYVQELQPEFLVMENVKELLSGNQKHHFHALRSRLTELGYSVSAEVHDLAGFGLAQRRVRALVLAVRAGSPPSMPTPNGSSSTVRRVIGHLPPVEAGEVHRDDPMHVCPRNTEKVLARIRAIPQDGGSWADVMNDPDLTDHQKRAIANSRHVPGTPGLFPRCIRKAGLGSPGGYDHQGMRPRWEWALRAPRARPSSDRP